MEALLAREQAAAAAAQARAASAVEVRSTVPSKKQKKQEYPRPARPLPVANDDDDEEQDDPLLAAAAEDDEDEDDEELAENGSVTAQALTDPSSDAQAEATVGRRVYVDGLVARRDLNGGGASVIQWRADAQRWEIEMDRRDELVMVRSVNLRFLDVAPPAQRTKHAAGPAVPMLSKKKKKKEKLSAAAAPTEPLGKATKRKKVHHDA